MTQTAAGVLVIDKPLGITSHDAVQHVRRVSGIRRVGHAGTLDPLATGVLVICVGWATRLVEYVQGGRKTYETTVRLGQTTTTYDAEGEVVVERPVAVTAATVAGALVPFRGLIKQQAPAYSAIKRNGQPLYKAARRGEILDLPVREVTIYSVELLDFRSPEVDLRVVCSPGTYIRSLAHDLGETLGCGGHVATLRRTASGSFSTDDAVALGALSADTWRATLLPPSAAVAGMPQIAITVQEVAELRQGRAVPVYDRMPDGATAAAIGPDGCLLGIVEIQAAIIQPRKMAPTNG